MALISDTYRHLQQELHGRFNYGIGGHRWVEGVKLLMDAFVCESILDYGCGRGLLTKGLLAKGIDVVTSEYDPAVAGKDLPPEPADLVVCTDVLEHIEPDCLDDVLSDLARLTKKVLLVNISTRPAVKVLADGRNAHILLMSPDQWLVLLTGRFGVRRWEVGIDEVIAILVPRAGDAGQDARSENGHDAVHKLDPVRQVLSFLKPFDVAAKEAEALQAISLEGDQARPDDKEPVKAGLAGKAAPKNASPPQGSLAGEQRTAQDALRRQATRRKRAAATLLRLRAERMSNRRSEEHHRSVADAAALELAARTADLKGAKDSLDRLQRQLRIAETAASDARSEADRLRSQGDDHLARLAASEIVNESLSAELAKAREMASLVAVPEQDAAEPAEDALAEHPADEPAPVEPVPVAGPRGAWLTLANDTLLGWAIHRDASPVAALVEVEIEDQFTTVVIANHAMGAGLVGPPEAAGCGFEVPLAHLVKGDAPQTIRLRLAETGETLAGTPITVKRGGQGLEIVDDAALLAATVTPTKPPEEPSLNELKAAAKKGDYRVWHRLYGEAAPDMITRRADEAEVNAIRISVIVLGLPDHAAAMERTLASLTAQAYGHFEIVLAGPVPTAFARSPIVVRASDGDLGTLLAQAKGEYATFVMAGDVLAPHALVTGAAFIRANPDAGLVYSDEDHIDAGGIRSDPYFKGGWDPDLAAAQDYFCRAAFVRVAEALDCAGTEAANHFGLYRTLLRHRTVYRQPVVRCPFVLYHRAVGATAHDDDEMLTARVVGDLLTMDGSEVCPSVSRIGRSMRRVVFPAPSTPPLVSVVIPTRDGATLLRSCVMGLLHRTRYPAIEVVIVDNGSVEPETFALFDELRQLSRVKIVLFPGPFNYSAINNFGVEQSSGSMIVLMNNDIEISDENWLDAMVAQGVRSDVGAVGAKLLYADGTIQHAGIVLGVGGIASHIFKRMQDGVGGYHHRLTVTQEYSAVTAACMLMRRQVWDEVGGLSLDFPVAFNDVDLCLRIRAAGYRIIWTPQASLYHLESASRGREDNPDKQRRFADDKAKMMQRWRPVIVDDPFFNPNLALTSTACLPAFPPRTDLSWYL
ncbi:glycosyltransferase [Methylorubrum sp. POS3]|uniref:glycosyltransferase n=1 Tax=Methylorubrum sp. POS3 TaxID=2998492 RepID=UPI003729F7EA